MIEQLAAVDKETAEARSKARASIEALCLPEEELAAIEEVSPIPGLREQSLGVVGEV